VFRTGISILAICCVLAIAAFGAAIDGKWVAEVKMQAGKKAGAEERVVQMTLDLKSERNVLKGTVTSAAGRRDVSLEITEGKIEGNKFSFVTIQKGRQGEQKIVWDGTVEGDKITGERKREGARRGTPFTAKKQ